VKGYREWKAGGKRGVCMSLGGKSGKGTKETPLIRPPPRERSRDGGRGDGDL